MQERSHLFFPKIFGIGWTLRQYETYSDIVLKHKTVDTSIHTGFFLSLINGSARCDANTPSVSDVMLRKLYEPRKWGFDDQHDLIQT